MEYQKAIRSQISYVLERSSFYQKKFAGMTVDDVVNKFSSLPFTTKKEILDDQLFLPPYGSNLCVDPKQIRRIHKTSGTTQTPVVIALTQKDIENVLEVGAACFSACGLSSKNTVVHCLNFNMWAGGLTDCLSLENTGAAVVPFGVGHTKLLIETIKLLKIDAIHCTPSYMSKIEQVLKDEFNMRPIELGLKLGLFGAESGLQNDEFRKSLEQKWGINAFNANYGMSEVLSMIASECQHKNGLHYRASDKLYVELVDSKTGESVPIKKHAKGEMVFTNLFKEAQPLVRYRSGDIIEIKDLECSCGAKGFIFEIVGRSDDLLVIRGLNVFVSAIEKVVNGWLEHLNGVYEIHINKSDPIDKVVIKAEPNKNIKLSSEELILQITSDIKNKLSISVDIVLVPEGTIERVEGKTKRVKRVL